jgi:hypothetical protein
MECPLLAHLNSEEKESIAARRRDYFTGQGQLGSKRYPSRSERSPSPVLGGRRQFNDLPGWIDADNSTRFPQPVWPHTEKSVRLLTRNSSPSPHNDERSGNEPAPRE